MDSVLVEDTEQKQTQLGRMDVLVLMHTVDSQETTMVKWLFQTKTQVGQLLVHTVIATHRKYTKVWHLLLEHTAHKVLDSVGYVAVVGVYHTEQAGKVQ